MPESIARVIEVMTNAVRTEIIRHLTRRSMTARELADETGVVYSSIHRHLQVLSEQGLVVSDSPDDGPRGPIGARWSTVPARVRKLGEEWIAYALDQSDGRG